MNRFLLDSGIANLYVARDPAVRDRATQEAHRGNIVGICTPVLGELHHGVENSDSRDRNHQRLILALPTLTVWPFDNAAAAEYGRIQAELRRLGRKMQQIDAQIAAIARLLKNCVVVSADSDLPDVPGLVVEDWSKPPGTPVARRRRSRR